MWSKVTKKCIIYLLDQGQSLHQDIPWLSIILYPAKQKNNKKCIKSKEKKSSNLS